MNTKIRKARSQDIPFLREMLYEAIFVPEDEVKPPFSIIDNTEIFKYLAGWMKETDTGFIAEIDGQAVGAAWARLFENAAVGGYGFINSNTPELCLAIHKKYRDKGIGTALMRDLMAELKTKGYSSLSLSVDKLNRAADLYKKLGFRIHQEQETDYLMIKII